MTRVYFDNAATAPINPVALQAYLEQARELGNPSSLHGYGREARKKVEDAREKMATFLECQPNEIIFTASGTESNNLAIKGIYWHRIAEDKKRKVIITSTFEHHAVLDPINWLRDSEGAEIIEVPVDRDGY